MECNLPKRDGGRGDGGDNGILVFKGTCVRGEDEADGLLVWWNRLADVGLRALAFRLDLVIQSG